jgi:hypothetical protein
MPLTQTEADILLGLPKEFVESEPLEFPTTQPLDYERVLRSTDRREEFIFTIERGRRKRIRLKFQTRARKVIVLARLDLNGPAHTNPPQSPHRPGERLECPHLHLYREGFDDRIAFLINEAPGFSLQDAASGLRCLEDFLTFCHVQNWPNIQLSI